MYREIIIDINASLREMLAQTTERLHASIAETQALKWQLSEGQDRRKNALNALNSSTKELAGLRARIQGQADLVETLESKTNDVQMLEKYKSLLKDISQWQSNEVKVLD